MIFFLHYYDTSVIIMLERGEYVPKKTFLNLNRQKQERIISSSISVFSAKPFDHVTVKDIVEAAQIPRGSFYQYFDDLVDLYLHLIEYAQRVKMVYVEPILTRVGQEPFLNLYLELFEAGLTFAKAHFDLYQVGSHLFLSQNPQLIKHMKAIEQQGIDALSYLLKKDQETGFIKTHIDVVMIAKILYHLNVRDLIYELYKGTPDQEIIQMVEKILIIIKYGAYKEDTNG